MRNKFKKRFFLFILIISIFFLATHSYPQTKAKVSKGDSLSLFDGKSLTGWEISNFEGHGKIHVNENSIIIEKGETCSGIKCTRNIPKNNYEITLEAKRIDGNDFFCGLTFPVKDENCTLIIGGWGGTVVGLSCIDGLDASENETGFMKKFQKEQWYNIRLRVTEKSIRAWINEERFIDFEKNEQKLSLRWEVEPSKPFGIATWKTSAALRNIKLHKF